MGSIHNGNEIARLFVSAALYNLFEDEKNAVCIAGVVGVPRFGGFDRDVWPVELQKLRCVSVVPYASGADISLGWFLIATSQLPTNSSNHFVVTYYRRCQQYVKELLDTYGENALRTFERGVGDD